MTSLAKSNVSILDASEPVASKLSAAALSFFANSRIDCASAAIIIVSLGMMEELFLPKKKRLMTEDVEAYLYAKKTDWHALLI